MPRLALFLMLLLAVVTPAPAQTPLREAIAARLARDTALVSVALVDPVSGLTVLHHADRRYHAASTMKVPVLVELARRIDAGELAWETPWLVRNQFASIMDGSAYRLTASEDSDSTLYLKEGQAVPAGEMAHLMIARSSNLATNILIERLGAAQVNATARALGADSIEVLRGVEDQKAFDAGRNNTTTARDLATLLLAIADGKTASAASSARMLAILEAQEFNEGIPAGLPPGTRVAHKTGWITATSHDAALVWLEGQPYALVVLTRGYADDAGWMAVMREVARMAHRAVSQARAAR